MARLFEPFFTTKPTGQGTGLGLAVVHGIVQAHQGAIVVSSQSGAGTAIHIYLPAAAGMATVEQADVRAAPRGQGEHILFVDDEPDLVALGTELLSDLGYRVSGFTRASAAIEELRGRLDSVDLVISDLTMPEMSGLDLARTLLAERPDLPIILTTGYSGALTQEEMVLAGIRALISKPAMLEMLATTVRDHVRRRG